MLSLRWKLGALLAFLLAGSAWGQVTYNCLPSCSSSDARFLAIANGVGFVTLSQPTLDLEIGVPKGTTSFSVGIFDGDSKGVDGSLVAHWDSGTAAVYTYTLYDDPNRDHAAATVVPLGSLPTQLSTTMPDNAWIDFTVNTDAGAQAPSGNYFYLLRIQLTTPVIPNLNAFKIRTSGANVSGSSLFPSPQPFSYIANLAGNGDAGIVYPAFPSATPTTYDGTFDFFFDQPVSQSDITVWDGDFDYGKFDGTIKDTDDPDTPNAPFRPVWATTDTVPEGVATGLGSSTGNPPDDGNPAGAGLYLVKPPSVRYDLFFPDGRSFANNDPSGNQEWEQFKISTAPFDRSQMDYHTDDLVPPGVFRVHLQGVDMQNLNALLLPGRALCVDASGVPCTPLHPYLIGDTVFIDSNSNGVQDPGEPGIAGVEVDLFDANNVPVAQTHTDANGHYSFEVEAFSYTVRIALSNYGTNESPGILFGYTPTTPEQCQVTITNDNNLTCDFGYDRPGSVGDRVWNDFNGNGVQDPGEPGINGVPVGLYDSNNHLVGSDTTNGDGNYMINNVPAGTYTVRVDDTFLPGGLTPTYDLDGIATPNAAVVTVAGGQARTDVDFGYQGNAEIGDRVWNDVNGNGVQDPGEPGIPGVTVQLQDDSGNPIVNTVTGVDGHYSFDHLAEGTYIILVDTTTLPPGSTETYDFDGTDSPDGVYYFFAEAGTTNNDIDFGYQTPVTATGSIGDRVWNDVNGDGVQDPSEAGLNGVTVQLYDGTNTLVGTTTTAGDGNYTFSNLAAGTYTVKIVAASLPPGVAETYDLDGVGTQNAATLDLATAQNRTDVDFGYQGTASVGDRVWLDTNGNGIQDAGEAGINGVQVQLLDAANNVLATATTSGDGNYSFSRLNGGNYSVQVVTASLPPGVTETYDLDGVITPNIASFSLNPGDSRTDVDFGYRGTASVGDRVWLDSNGNGTQDAGETGINGVTVQLLDASNNVVATATTAGDGNYTFSNLTAGNYSVRVTPPAGLAETYDLDGVATANIASFALAGGQNRTDVDFGYRGTASVGDRVWLDSNGNGTQDAGETGINGVTVQLLDSSNNVVATATTAGDGNYTFSNLAAGNYSVRVTPPAGLAETYDLDGVATANVASFSLAAGQNRTDVDFGYRGTASVGDRVWLDTNGNGTQDAGETGINGVTVELLDSSNNVVGTATTSGDGNYTFSNLAAGTYTVRVSNLPAGVSETYDLDGVASANQATFPLASGQNRTDVDFGYRYTGSVGDRVWLDANGNGTQDAGETGINGVTVQLLDSSNNVVGTATTSGDGNYTFNNLAPGTYTVKVSNLPAGTTETFDLDGVATANQATFPLAGGQNRTDVDFGYRYNGSVGDRVWLDTNGNGVQDAGETGLNGVTVQLLDSSNNVVGTATTSGDGNYTFNNLAPGTYTVKVSNLPAGTTETFDLDGVATANQATFSLAAGQNRTDVDFGYRYNGSVGDRVWLDANGNGVQDAGETGINGVTVQLLDSSNNIVGTATTSGDGNYTFNNLAPGTYTVKVSGLPAGTTETFDLDGVATANQATFPLAAGQNRTDVDFGYRYNGSVGDRVWLDANGNGAQDAGEAGINGVTVQLLDSSNNVVGTATTSGDGNYTFNNLAPGTYTVKVVAATLPAGVAETYDLDGVASANQATFSLAAGQNRTDVDFGYRLNGSVGDRVWNDGNGDGVQDAGEPGINGVTVQLLDGGNNVIATTTTSGDGNYSFGGLGGGTYSVKIVAATLPAGFVETYDLDGVATANQATFSLAAGQNRTDVDFGYRKPAPTGTDCATAAPGDPAYVVNPAGHAFYMPGIGTDFIFTPVPGTFTQLADGTATLQGTLRSVSNPNNAFTVDIQLGGYTSTPPDGSPKLELSANAYIQNGGPVDPSTWYYYTTLTGTLTGIGNYTGAVIDITRFMQAFQVGVGANGKNTHFGASGWFELNIVSQPATGPTLTPTDRGDIDIDLGDCPPAASSIGDRVWNDANGNGIQDAGEAGINGATVRLLDAYGALVATTTTSGDGNYTFNGLIAGTYTVQVVPASLPAGVAPSYDLDGTGTPNSATVVLAANTSRTDVDFGYKGTASIGDRVWLDANGNGAQDAGEAGINGATVQLLDGANNVIATATTSGDGNYTFSNLNAGTYTVKVVAGSLPAGVSPSYDLDGVATANSATLTLAAGDNRTDVDFGYKNSGSVGDRVWLDANGNGVQDAGETGINGVTVQLLNASATVVATTTTSGDGNYTFNNLAAGTYTVKVSGLPAGTAETYDLDGVATANQATFTLAAAQNRTDVDFGYKNNGSVGDRVWLDANGNGVQDAGETGINGVTVQLLDSSANVVATTTTSGDGNYTFNNLAAGTYTVKVSGLPAGTAETYDLDGIATANMATFTLTAGQNRTDVDFGYRNTGSVGDRVWLDANGNGVQDAGETGINGVTVQLLDSANSVIGTATTSGDGNYTFGGLGAGTYTVKIVAASLPAGVAETYDLDGVATANQATFALAGGQNRTDVDFGYRTPPPSGTNCALPSISDPALNSGPNGHAFYLPGISTDFVFVPNPGSFVTAADGTAHLTGKLLSISNPANGFTVDVNFSGYTTAAGPGSPKEELNASAYVQNGGTVDPSTWYYYTAYTGTLTGTGSYAGAVLSLTNTGPAFQVGAGANGKNANPGASGWFLWNVVSQPTVGNNLQTTGQGDINIDLPDCSTLATVGDRVWLDANGNGTQDAGETGINGVTVQLVDNSGTVRFAAITSGDGNYTFTDVPGSYSVRVVPSTLPAGLAPSYDLDGVATANVASFTLAAGQNRTDVDFGYKNGGSIGDRVWLDTNGNGTQDAGEAGINGVTVQLLNSANTVVATATTSGDGNYTFGNLTAGTYTVKIVAASLPAGVTATYDLDGIATANQAAVTLAAGQNRTDVDFGYKNTGSVGDRVWLDANGNGTQDAGETGINGATVQLLNSGGTVIATTTTSGDGNYTFSNLAAGTYTVKVSGLPAGTAATYDLDGIATANQATFALTAGQNRTDVDFGYKNTGSIGDRVWLDANGNGTQDAGEAGINGATVQLLNSGGTVIATTTTSGDGNYTFSNLAAGTYTVKVSGLPAGTAATYDLDGIATANQAAVTLTAGQNRTDVDFGYKYTGSIGDRVWLDANGNGTQDAGEAGINGVTVQLVNSGGTVIATTTTSGDGNYTFSNLAAGTYTVKVTSGLPAGTAATYDLDGIATANQAAVTLTAGQNRTDVDFGYRYTGSVGDRVWNDVNGNGTQDSGETGINGVTVQLVNSGGTVIATTTTSGDGNYTFSNLAAGSYTVKIVTSTLPAGATQTYDLDGLGSANQATFTLTAGQNRTDVDFGYRALGSVGDRVWLDSNGNGIQDAGEIGFDGLTVQLLNSSGTVIATTTTTGDGNYIFTNLAAGNYSVRVVTLPGMMATYDLDGVVTPNFATFTLAGGQNRTDVDFGVRVNGCAEGAPLDPTYGPTTGGQAFWFPGIVTDLVFTPSPGGFIVNGDGTARLTGTLRSVSDPTKVFTVDVSFSGLTGTAPSGSPKKELQSSAYVENGGPINTATWLYFTSYSGTLTGSGTYAGAVITISRTGPAFQMGVGADGKNLNFGGSGWFLWTVTHQPTSGTNLQTTGQGDIDVDLDDCNTLGSIGNRVWTDTNGNGTQDSGETGINGVTVQLLNAGGTAFASAITSGDGNYTFDGIPAGTYMVNIVTSTLPTGVSETYDLDGVSSANKATFTLAAAQDRTDVDFGYRTSLSIGDRVWNDVDGDGNQDSGEAGISGVTVQLLNSGGTVIATTTTNGSGNYTFSGLTAGTYKVKIVTSSLPASSIQTYDLDGLSTANIATVTLTTASRTDVDFGYRTNCTLSIGNRVWDDSDGDGHQDSSEDGINGVTVQLLNSGGTVIATTTTSGDGNYTFSNLNAATYTVKIVTGTLPSGATPSYDLDGTSTANKATVNLTASRSDVDFGYSHCGSHR